MGRRLFDDRVLSASVATGPASVRALPFSLAIHAMAVAAVATLSVSAVREPPLRGPIVYQPGPRPAEGGPRVIVKGGGPRPPRRETAHLAVIADPRPPVVTDVPALDLETETSDGTTDGSPACLTGCDPGVPGGGDETGAAGPDGTGDGPGPPLRVGGDIREPRRIQGSGPVYPELARRARVQGKVVLECVIDTDGRVTELRVVSGHALLADAAGDAVRGWVYTPTTLNGQPIRVILTVTVTFQLARH
jgi:protein TonB